MCTFLAPKQLANLLSEYGYPWAIAGGWSIDLFLHRETRSHKDIDVMVFRDDWVKISNYLQQRNWSLKLVDSGQLYPVEDEVPLKDSVFNVFCEHQLLELDFIELLVEHTSEDMWIYRRDSKISKPLRQTIQMSQLGIPILVPELALLYKSKYPEELSNRHDFEVALPELSMEQKNWLSWAIEQTNESHVWIDKLQRNTSYELTSSDSTKR